MAFGFFKPPPPPPPPPPTLLDQVDPVTAAVVAGALVLLLLFYLSGKKRAPPLKPPKPLQDADTLRSKLSAPENLVTFDMPSYAAVRLGATWNPKILKPRKSLDAIRLWGTETHGTPCKGRYFLATKLQSRKRCV